MLMHTADDIPISIRELTDFFKPKSCPGLSNKPKLFFIEVLVSSLMITFSRLVQM